MKIKALSLALLLTTISGAAGASGINDAMYEQFGTMQNVTQPAVIIGPEGGVVTGGALRMRMPIRSLTPVRITPPGGRAGCGGIDLHGGSLSFPSAQEFVQVARSVAGNVGGYAFKLALSSMCQTCENIMSAIQEMNNQFNKMDLDSCTLAQDLVENGGRETATAAESAARGVGIAWNTAFSSDRLEGSQQGKDEAPAAEMSQEEREAAFEGNFVWQALQKAQGVVPDFPSTRENREVLMSMLGTVVFCAQGVDGCPERDPDERLGEGMGEIVPHTLTLKDLLDGGTKLVLTCGDDRCLNVGSGPRDLGTSMVVRMEDAFLDDDGILDRLSAPADGSNKLSDEQSAWLGLLGPTSQSVMQMAAAGEQGRGLAETYIRTSSRAILAAYYSNMMEDVAREVRRHLEFDHRSGAAAAARLLVESQDRIRADRASEGDIVTLENNLLAVSQQYMSALAPRVAAINVTAAEVSGAGD